MLHTGSATFQGHRVDLESLGAFESEGLLPMAGIPETSLDGGSAGMTRTRSLTRLLPMRPSTRNNRPHHLLLPILKGGLVLHWLLSYRRRKT
jgi:hypothetical protein